MSMGKSSTPCRYFRQGQCRYTDEECRFAHILPANPPPVRATGNPPRVRARASGSREPAFWDDLDYLDNSERYSAKDINPNSLFGKWRTSWRKQNNIGVESSNRRGRKKKPYKEPTFTAAESCCFAKTEAWDEKRLDEAGIKAIRFWEDFRIEDTHLAAISSRPYLASSLVLLSLGNSDSGNGSRITDSPIINFVHACPNLRVLQLESATRLTDAAFSACCDSGPSLESLSITGNDKVSGSLTGSSLKRLMASTEVAKNLKKLVLYDQRSCSRAQIEKLSKSRRDLAVETGNSVGDGIADYMVAQMMGGETTETWLGGKVVSSHTDGGFNFPDCDDGGYDHEAAVHSFTMEMGYFPDWAGGDIPKGY